MNSTKPTEQTRDRADVAFAAIDPYIETNIVSPVETPVHGKDFIEWGTGNAYPDYLKGLTETVPTLRSIINGTVEFIAGDDVSIKPLHPGFENGVMNGRGDTIAEQVDDIARDYETYGGFALQVIRGRDGGVAEIYHVPIRFLRANKECNVFYYCEDWGKRGKKDTVVYPAFIPGLRDKWAAMDDDERNRNASSILYVKTDHSHTYPVPVYAASVTACETERLIDEYHLNSISNGFCPSVIINFNNGIPTDQMKEEIERDATEKFGGPSNAGRMMFCWNANKDSATTFEVPPVTDFGDKYKALAENSREKIFTAFRAIPLIFGLTAGTNTGFSTDEFEQSFRLYNRTAVRPVQRMIADAYDKIYNAKGVLTIVPFSLGGANEQTVN